MWAWLWVSCSAAPADEPVPHAATMRLFDRAVAFVTSVTSQLRDPWLPFPAADCEATIAEASEHADQPLCFFFPDPFPTANGGCRIGNPFVSRCSAPYAGNRTRLTMQSQWVPSAARRQRAS